MVENRAAGGSVLTYLTQNDPRGWIPSWLTNQVIKKKKKKIWWIVFLIPFLFSLIRQQRNSHHKSLTSWSRLLLLMKNGKKNENENWKMKERNWKMKNTISHHIWNSFLKKKKLGKESKPVQRANVHGVESSKFWKKKKKIVLFGQKQNFFVYFIFSLCCTRFVLHHPLFSLYFQCLCPFFPNQNQNHEVIFRIGADCFSKYLIWSLKVKKSVLNVILYAFPSFLNSQNRIFGMFSAFSGYSFIMSILNFQTKLNFLKTWVDVDLHLALDHQECSHQTERVLLQRHLHLQAVRKKTNEHNLNRKT